MANNSEEEKEGQQKPRLYLLNLDGYNHTRIVNAQYLRDTVHKLAGQSFCICQSKLALDHYKDGQHIHSAIQQGKILQRNVLFWFPVGHYLSRKGQRVN
jgi:hypothetical protein